MGDERGHRRTLSKGQRFILREGCGKVRNGGHGFGPGLHHQNWGEDEDRPEAQQDQAQSKDIVMPGEESPEKGKPKVLEPSWGDGLEEGDCPLGGEDHQLPESGEKNNSGKEEKGDPDPMTEEVRRLVEESY